MDREFVATSDGTYVDLKKYGVAGRSGRRPGNGPEWQNESNAGALNATHDKLEAKGFKYESSYNDGGNKVHTYSRPSAKDSESDDLVHIKESSDGNHHVYMSL